MIKWRSLSMAAKTDEMYKLLLDVNNKQIEQGSDIKWIKETTAGIHGEVKRTNGRVTKLESESHDYLKKEDFTIYKEGVNNSSWDFKKSVVVALISAIVTIICLFVYVKYGVKLA
jgi:hypothetical protein